MIAMLLQPKHALGLAIALLVSVLLVLLGLLNSEWRAITRSRRSEER